jgi:hypothetical protein
MSAAVTPRRFLTPLTMPISEFHSTRLQSGADMKRQKISEDKLLNLLLAEIALNIRDVHLLRQQIKIRPSSGEPNWDVSAGHQSGPVAAAIDKARRKIQASHNVEWH